APPTPSPTSTRPSPWSTTPYCAPTGPSPCAPSTTGRPWHDDRARGAARPRPRGTLATGGSALPALPAGGVAAARGGGRRHHRRAGGSGRTVRDVLGHGVAGAARRVVRDRRPLLVVEHDRDGRPRARPPAR